MATSKGFSPLRKIKKRLFPRKNKPAGPARPFPGVRSYWEERYAGGGTSGAGSTGRLAMFKAQFLNDFVESRAIGTVLELGCGDGDQLFLARYPSYVGVDISQGAIELCRAKFAGDESKSFFHASADDYRRRYDLVLSLDVIFHLVEDDVFARYMGDLRSLAAKYIVIYSSNKDEPPGLWSPHVRHRMFTAEMEAHADAWRLAAKVDNPFPFAADDPDNTSFSDFYVYERRGATGA